MEKKINFSNDRDVRGIYGGKEKNLDYIRDKLGIEIVARGDFLKIKGDSDNVHVTETLFNELNNVYKKGHVISEQELRNAVDGLCEGDKKIEKMFKERIGVSGRKSFIVPKTPGQREYVHAMQNYDLVFAIGPAGTGKTYLAMAMAVNYLTAKRVSRIILVRPAVEAGEALGFLPGDMHEKVNPYLRPLYDALYDMMDVNTIQELREKGIIEVAPLAYMRGRTLNDSFVIMDEAQNTTKEQMKMFLTRLGFDTKTIVTGDITQIDLPDKKPSGLVHVSGILKNIKDIEFVLFKKRDVVRHELVTKIIHAYEKEDKRNTTE